MCSKCQTLIEALKEANTDKDKVITHLTYELAEATDKLKAITEVVERAGA
jgi:hypothetical protein